ncbi:tripartite tricarboxylate transporter TctB family protein [Palleronia sp. LCG004]|uniref:tripartite tricarboxylate transporter TctB family protein n=1 Tax=Palleronia sp. LCG004 TaxID=3079304 RepID=UPI0029422C80|nr:tripartite tricarboxylate transporter TctB family protein [Palleronia sp. LCG004]WOI57132.1 tripartite tricarboxylate transporter TctB family protein [Palleronia sp. LCG004]
MTTRIVGAAVFVIAALFVMQARLYEAPFGDVLGPAVFPVIVGIPAMMLSASLVVWPGSEVAWPRPERLLRQGAALVVLLGYAWLLVPLGFLIATFLLVALLAIVLDGPAGKSVVLGAVIAPALWALFDRVLGLPLAPLGTWF